MKFKKAIDYPTYSIRQQISLLPAELLIQAQLNEDEMMKLARAISIKTPYKVETVMQVLKKIL